jgi:secreted trypsin-like serine protease
MTLTTRIFLLATVHDNTFNHDRSHLFQGDSGGPLQIYHVGDEIKCMYDIIGITSSSKFCLGNPGIYTRVSYFIKWIEDIVWP